MAPAVDTLR